MRVIILSLLMTLVFFSCKKDESTELAPADASIAKNVFDGIRDEVDQQLNQESLLNGARSSNVDSRGGCASVSISPLGGTFPKTITIVFPENCHTFAGASIEGVVTIVISGRIREAGTTADFTLKDFKYKTFVFSGNYQVTFDGALSHTTKITDGKVVNALGETITYMATNVSTQTSGTNTTFKTNPLTFLHDDVYSVTTTASGVNSKGNSYFINTSSPLVYKVGCQWITSGVIEIVENANPKITAMFDFGIDVCDNKATLTYNGKSNEVTLP